MILALMKDFIAYVMFIILYLSIILALIKGFNAYVMIYILYLLMVLGLTNCSKACAKSKSK